MSKRVEALITWDEKPHPLIEIEIGPIILRGRIATVSQSSAGEIVGVMFEEQSRLFLVKDLTGEEKRNG